MSASNKPRTLDGALAKRGTLTALAKKLDITISYLCDIRMGRKTPSLELALEIAAETGVPVASLVAPRKAA